MGKKYQELESRHIDFIKKQHMFFVATIGSNTTINISPKDTENFKIIDKNTCIWRNLTGSGNETAAHLQENNKMTIMFNSFDESPKILRLYGTATTYLSNSKQFKELDNHFIKDIGARQIFKMKINLVHISCGFGVPLYQYQGKRDLIESWTSKKGIDGIKQYQKDRNQTSLDNKKIKIC
ncbi:MAG: pyridoxamine 5'-phosphate oxidase family protein [Gammaproteobacteria bacterium]|nr:MAG: pyridoxamine 5'-phosphate oxidase family protein [Gammaproteobacteria bacterium]